MLSNLVSCCSLRCSSLLPLAFLEYQHFKVSSFAGHLHNNVMHSDTFSSGVTMRGCCRGILYACLQLMMIQGTVRLLYATIRRSLSVRRCTRQRSNAPRGAASLSASFTQRCFQTRHSATASSAKSEREKHKISQSVCR